MRISDIFIIAVWAATIFGLAEGLVLAISRAYPVILAPLKASVNILWIAPLVDLPLFILAGIGLVILLRLARRWIAGLELTIAYGFFIFIGVFTMVETPKVIHLIAVTVLSLGLSVALTRQLRGSEAKLTGLLRRRLILIPLIIIVAALGVFGYETGLEMWHARQLSSTTFAFGNLPWS